MKDSKDYKLKICLLHPPGRSNLIIYPGAEILGYLTRFGHEVTWIISVSEDEAYQAIPQDIRAHIISYRNNRFGGSALAKAVNRILNQLKRARTTLKLFRDNRHDIVLVRDNIFDGLLAVYIKRKYKVPFVFNLSDPLEQKMHIARIEGQKPRFLYYLNAWFSERIAIYLLHKADLVLAMSMSLKQNLVERGISEKKIIPFPAGVNVALFSEGNIHSIRQRYHLEKVKVVIYSGTLSKARELDFLIKCFSQVKAKMKNIRLLMVGRGTDEENLKRLTHELELDDYIIFTGQVPRSEVPDYIAAADIGISPIPPTSNYKLSSPIKPLEYMATGKPVIANKEIPEHKVIIEQSSGGILVTYDIRSFTDAIIDLLSDLSKAEEMGKKGRDWTIRNRAYEVLAGQVSNALRELEIQSG